jgi:hypothetical protein
MSRRKKVISPNQHLYSRVPHFTTSENRYIERGDIIKIKGEWGTKFRFHEHVTRTDSGAEWIDCFEIEKGQVCGQRSFRKERVKALPKPKNKRKMV